MCHNSDLHAFHRRSGEIGRRTGLKIPRGKTRAGSIPASGTILKTAQHSVVRFFFTHICLLVDFFLNFLTFSLLLRG